ncbi:MAG: hypothetical protein ACO3UX_13180, partial [Candidatus Nanopelagicales bacterium]
MELVIAAAILAIAGVAIAALRRGPTSTEQPVDTPAPTIDPSVLVSAVREAVDAQIRKTTSETLADT